MHICALSCGNWFASIRNNTSIYCCICPLTRFTYCYVKPTIFRSKCTFQTESMPFIIVYYSGNYIVQKHVNKPIIHNTSKRLSQRKVPMLAMMYCFPQGWPLWQKWSFLLFHSWRNWEARTTDTRFLLTIIVQSYGCYKIARAVKSFT